MTLERRVAANGDTRVVTVECPLCGEPLRDRHPLSLHIRRSCPARERFRRPGALQDGGPDLAATDGGDTVGYSCVTVFHTRGVENRHVLITDSMRSVDAVLRLRPSAQSADPGSELHPRRYRARHRAPSRLSDEPAVEATVLPGERPPLTLEGPDPRR